MVWLSRFIIIFPDGNYFTEMPSAVAICNLGKLVHIVLTDGTMG